MSKPAPKPESTSHLRTLANGAIYDMNKKRIINSQNVTTKITAGNAIALQSRQQELKRAALMRAANAVAAQGGGVDGRLMQGDMAYVEAIGEAMTMKALTVNDPKAVDAARFIFTETGVAESRQLVDNTPIQQATAFLEALPAIVALMRAAIQPADAQIHATNTSVIDAE